MSNSIPEESNQLQVTYDLLLKKPKQVRQLPPSNCTFQKGLSTSLLNGFFNKEGGLYTFRLPPSYISFSTFPKKALFPLSLPLESSQLADRQTNRHWLQPDRAGWRQKEEEEKIHPVVRPSFLFQPRRRNKIETPSFSSFFRRRGEKAPESISSYTTRSVEEGFYLHSVCMSV